MVAGVALGVAAAVPAAPTPESARALVERTTEQVLSELRSSREAYRQDRKKLNEFIDETVFRHFDFERIARRILGRHWRTASDAQKARFIDEFRKLLLRTYSTALVDYSDAEVKIGPARPRGSSGDVTINTEVLLPAAPKVPINYTLYADGDSWKVYDVTIDGISLVITYRASFANEVRRSGFDGLLERLVALNSKEADSAGAQ